MIILDTHIWFRYINDGLQTLTDEAKKTIKNTDILGVSIISCWEIAMLVSKGRLKFSIDIQDWITQALKYKGIKLINLTPEIAVLSTRLPGDFHKDPADQIIVATSRILEMPLLSSDRRILSFKDVDAVW